MVWTIDTLGGREDLGKVGRDREARDWVVLVRALSRGGSEDGGEGWERARRSERMVRRVPREWAWEVRGDSGVPGVGEEVPEPWAERRRVGVVCMPMSLWKSSVGSEVILDVSELSSCTAWLGRKTGRSSSGRWLTLLASCEFSFSRFCKVVWLRSWRAWVKESSMGCTRNLFAP